MQGTSVAERGASSQPTDAVALLEIAHEGIPTSETVENLRKSYRAHRVVIDLKPLVLTGLSPTVTAAHPASMIFN